MNADQRLLYSSEHYKIIDFRCQCGKGVISGWEPQDYFSFSYIRKGNYLYNIFRNSLDVFNGCFLIDKPGYEHSVKHIHEIPDECSIFRFDDDYYRIVKKEYCNKEEKFFNNNDIHSILVKTGYETEYLYYAILRNIKNNSPRLVIDDLVAELLHHILSSIFQNNPHLGIPDALKRNHLSTLERAKDYIADNFENDITLNEIAGHCHVSPFHFSRIFRSFNSSSPYQYLMNTRLKNAELLLRSTGLSVTEICFASGFNNLERFSAAFKKKYFSSPRSFRLKNSKIY